MTSKTRLRIGTLRAALIALVAVAGVGVYSTDPVFEAATFQQPATGKGNISGTVTSTQGAEGGVWVIAETKELPTNFIKIVVTDNQGKFMVPELPANVTYNVWVRGYGLADSTPVQLKAGASNVALKATVARTPQEAAKVYPGDYWMSMMEPPVKSAFPVGNVRTQENWMWTFKSSCNFCHQLGNEETRDLKHVFEAVPTLKTPEEAWDYRLRAGIRGTQMNGAANGLDRPTAIKMLVDWTTRIEKGEVPAHKPPRPSGVEQNVVLTLWDWGTDHSFMHDEASTSKQKPSVNGNGPVYAVSAGHGTLVMLDEKTNSTLEIELPTRQARDQVPSRFPAANPPSIHWGAQRLWAGAAYDPADPHNPMLDNTGRVWMTSKIRNQQPAWCSDQNATKYAAYRPLTNSGRQASYYDPKTQKFQLIETCYSTHHLQFDNDPNDTVYFNELSGPIIGWVNTKLYDKTLADTHDEVKAEQTAVGWCPQVIDTNGDGKITKPWNQVRAGVDNILNLGDTGGAGGNNFAAQGQGGRAGGRGPGGGAGAGVGQGRGRGAPGAGGQGARGRGAPAAFDPALDSELSGTSLYSVIPSPVDDSVWGVAESFPGFLVRLRTGANPPETCMTQLFRVPEGGLDPRGVDVDRNGVVWTALAASSHLASFDVRKCKKLTGPWPTNGDICTEGWTLYQTTGPRFKGTDYPTDFHYFNWVDQYDVLGFGANTPMATGSNSDSILVLDPKSGKWTTLRVPYALGFYSRGMDARLDNPNAPAGFAGWKDRALYANYGTHFVWHIEGGKGTKGKLVKFQVRPNPLAN
ncbi:MAG TPA: carboxypeptidase-like regulatory domain-containing protein [Terriglobia bacterium]|nr:carboxypeptidase-like regulatory domain-containing protein [Terriglobia bacterium]